MLLEGPNLLPTHLDAIEIKIAEMRKDHMFLLEANSNHEQIRPSRPLIAFKTCTSCGRNDNIIKRLISILKNNKGSK